MKLLLDQGLPRTIGAILRKAGIDAVHVGEIALASADDAVLLERARGEGQIVVTFDADFHQLLAIANAHRPSVIRIRIEGLRAERCAALLREIVDRSERELAQGAALSVTKRRIRVRRLPLQSS
jgi:predicted nuclease of predicted toxin-antitoxin system